MKDLEPSTAYILKVEAIREFKDKFYPIVVKQVNFTTLKCGDECSGTTGIIIIDIFSIKSDEVNLEGLVPVPSGFISELVHTYELMLHLSIYGVQFVENRLK